MLYPTQKVSIKTRLNSVMIYYKYAFLNFTLKSMENNFSIITPVPSKVGIVFDTYLSTKLCQASKLYQLPHSIPRLYVLIDFRNLFKSEA